MQTLLERALRSFAVHYCGVLLAAEKAYLNGNDDMLRGLEIFDTEEVNICHGYAWAKQHRDSDQLAAEMCRDYVLGGADIIYLRLPPQERYTWFEDALKTCIGLKDYLGGGDALANLGTTWNALGQTNKAVECWESAMKVFRSADDVERQVAVQVNLGNACGSLGQWREAISHYESVVAASNDLRRRGTALANLGSAWLNLQDPVQAIHHYQEALKAMQVIGDLRGKGAVLANLGNAWALCQNWPNAIDCHNEGLKLRRDVGDQPGIALSLSAISNIEHHLGQLPDAINHAAEALSIFTEIESPHAEMVRHWLAELRGEAPA